MFEGPQNISTKIKCSETKCVFRNFAKFTGNTCARGLSLSNTSCDCYISIKVLPLTSKLIRVHFLFTNCVLLGNTP